MRVLYLMTLATLLAACAVDEPAAPDHDATLDESDDAGVAEPLTREDLLALMEPACGEAAQASEVAQAVCAVTCSTALALGCGAVLVACHGAVAFSAGGALIPCGLAVKVACGGVIAGVPGCAALCSAL